jgi:Tfp pilus assembly PilM family ATPase
MIDMIDQLVASYYAQINQLELQIHALKGGIASLQALRSHMLAATATPQENQPPLPDMMEDTVPTPAEDPSPPQT